MPEVIEMVCQPRAAFYVEPSHSVLFSKSFSSFTKSSHSVISSTAKSS